MTIGWMGTRVTRIPKKHRPPDPPSLEKLNRVDTTYKTYTPPNLQGFACCGCATVRKGWNAIDAFLVSR